MKIFKSIILAFLLILGNSCTLDLLEDPNNVPMTGTRATLLLNSMQRSVANLFQTSSTFGMQMTRQQNSAGVQYFNVYGPQSFDGMWSTAYAGILQDAQAVITFADDNGWARHAGLARILSAYTLLQLVDYFGDVPYSEALNGLSNLNPKVDDDQQLYTVALELLDRAEPDLKTALTTAATPGYLNPLAETPADLYYANNYGFWIRLINSLKLKAYLNLRLITPAAAQAGIDAVLADPDGLIVNQNHNWVFRYGANISDPDSRHPRFTANYPGGGGNYMSNYMMWQMYHAYNATSVNATVGKGDPRMRFYFYRQTNANNTDPNNIRCVTATSIPAHYPARVGAEVVYGVAGIPPGISTDPANDAWSSASGTLSRTFCYPTNVGYWGRDHVDNQGIPPDGLLRTAWGAYPAGGRFDNNVNIGVNATTRRGMGGAGFQPMMMRSFVQFMLAEAASTLTLTGASTPRTYYETGIRNSFQDVRDFVVNGTFGIGSAAATEATVGAANAAGAATAGINTFYPAADYATDVENYVTAALTAYDAQDATGRLNYIAREYWVAAFCNGVETYNLYRRTGMPTGMQPTLQPSPGDFPRTFFYPNNFATLNNTVQQRTDLKTRVFWDTNTSNLDF